jgi:Major Facilitator Superfamily
MSIFPYAYRMIETFDLTKDETQISIYAGMLITAFAFAEFSTGMLWGRVSDRIGRKPVLIMGLIGTAFSMVCFGFARSLTGAILARALGGLLNGNVGVLQTTVAELVTKKEHQPRAYSIMPFVWCLGSIIGPAMGGALAMPCEAYPWLFSRGGVFDTYPFLLPNLVCVMVLLFGITNGILFLEETHVEKKNRRDLGLQAGRCLVRKIFGEAALPNDNSCVFDSDGQESFDPPPGYRSTEGSPRVSTTTPSITSDEMESCTEKANNGLTKTFNRQVILVIIGYGILAYHSVSFDSLMPVFLSEPRSQAAPALPFKFSGGFELSTKKIGFMMAVQGIYSMIAQLWFFPFIVCRVGTLTAFRTVMVIWPILYFAVPYLVLLPQHFQIAGAYLCLLAKITFHVIAFPSNAILLANAAPSKSVLGTINGVAASTACLARAFGPTVSGAIHSFGLSFGCNGLAWWAGGLVCAIGAFESFFMEEVECRLDGPTQTEDDTCEPLLHSTTVETTDETLAPRNSLEEVPELDLSALKV